jgi:ABC-2 type transport system permease protein
VNLGKAFTIAVSSLRRLFRDRSNLFFVLIFPLLLVLLIGTLFGGGFTPAVGLVAPPGDDDPFAADFVGRLEDAEGIDIVRYDTQDDLLGAVERGTVQAGVVVPDGYGDDLESGEQVEVGFIARPSGFSAQLQSTVAGAVGPQSAQVRAARFATEEGGGDFDENLDRVRELQDAAPVVGVETTSIGEELFPSTLGRFDLGASSQLLLFMFVTALAGSAVLIQSRKLGVARRMLSTPTSMGTVLLGEGGGRYSVVLFQGVYIMLATRLLFGVDWGDPVGAVLIMLLFALVGAGAAMLIGATFQNDQQAAGIGIVLALSLGALGGSMTPLELFSPTMQRIAHLTPHAWAQDAFAELVRENGTVVDILPELAVLAGMAAVLLVLATFQLRRALTAG